MTKLGVFGATALSLSLAIATPVLAQQAQSGRTGMHASGANVGGARIGGAGPQVRSNFRGGQANVGSANFAGRSNAQFVQGAYRGGELRGDRGRGFGRDVAVGVVAGAAVASGAYGYGYSDPYYGDNYAYGSDYSGDSYAYDNGVTFDSGLPIVTFGQPAPVEGPMVASGDASYCAQRYRSYDSASGTYLGFDGLRHPCL